MAIVSRKAKNPYTPRGVGMSIPPGTKALSGEYQDGYLCSKL